MRFIDGSILGIITMLDKELMMFYQGTHEICYQKISYSPYRRKSDYLR